MPDNSSTAADELRLRAKFFRLGCIVNLILGAILVTMLAIVFPLIARTLGLTAPAADEAAIRAVLDAQTAAWNNGDLDGFMNGYWHDENLTFISGGDINQGWNVTRERYLKKYFTPGPGQRERGQLSFTDLHVESLGPTAALVRGCFTLTISTGNDSGRFTLLLRKMSEGWRIVHDHTSVPDKPKTDK